MAQRKHKIILAKHTKISYTEAMKETKQTITADPIINPEILALLDRMVKRTDKNIEIMRKQLKRERKQDEQNRKEINEALKKLIH